MSIFIGPFVPAIYDYLLPKHDLIYTIDNVIEVEDMVSVVITVSNKGQDIEKNVTMTIPNFVTSSKLSMLKYDSSRKLDVNSTNDNLKINFGNLRAGEAIQTSILLENAELLVLFNNELRNTDVVSEKRIAKNKSRDPILSSLYDKIFGVPIMIVLVGLFITIIIDLIRGPSGRIRWHQKQIEEIKEKLSKKKKKVE